MELIRKIRIEGLRSIQDQELDEIGSLNVFVGKNSSGKSNALRALNLFFNGVVEPGKSIDFTRDHFEQIPRKRKKKNIAISVSFRIPSTFYFRKGLEILELLGNEFTIRRSWQLDPLRRPQERLEVFHDDVTIHGGEDAGRQFLSLITYRYIPNRTVPSDILRDESQAIANSIFGRMKGDTHASALLEALTDAARRMLEEASHSLNSSGSPLHEPSVSTAESIGEMLTMGGFQARGAHGLPVQDEDWGAGHQAFFLYQVLRTLDTSYGRFFGWKQATIWGVEEPEAALHRDLETSLSEQFRQWCGSDKTKLQLFVTTHSPIFTMAADSGVWVDLIEGESRFERLSIPELTRAADVRGVSGWVHPILYFPWNPVILVEGQIDVDVLSHVANLSGLHHLRFVTVPNLDAMEKHGGKDKIIAFLKNSHGLIQNRSKEAPLIVLFDWEVSADDLKRARKYYGAGADRFVQKMSESHCSGLLSKDFAGIERFYPPKIVAEAHQANELIVGMKEGKPYSVSKNQLSGAKGALRDRLLAINSVSEVSQLLHVLMDVEESYREGRPVQMRIEGL